MGEGLLLKGLERMRKAVAEATEGEDWPEPPRWDMQCELEAFDSMVRADSKLRGSRAPCRACWRSWNTPLVLLHRELILPRLSEATRQELRALALRLLAAPSSKCSLNAAILLQHVGRPEDAARIEAHRPAEPILARVFDTAAQALRSLQAP